MKECITHHYACDCREAEWAEKLAESQARENIMRRQLVIAQELIHSVCCERHACVRGCSNIVTALAQIDGAQLNQVPEHLAAIKETNN